MATNKVEVFGKVVLDLTNDTVSPDTLAFGITAHDKSGKIITGTMRDGGVGESIPEIDIIQCCKDGSWPQFVYDAIEENVGEGYSDKYCYVDFKCARDALWKSSYSDDGVIHAFGEGENLAIEIEDYTDLNDASENYSYVVIYGMGYAVYFEGGTIFPVDENNVIEASFCSYDAETPSIDLSSDGLITASANGKTATRQLEVQDSKTVTPTKSSQTAVQSGRYTTGTITVDPIPDDYVIPSGTKDIDTNGTHPVSGFANVNVSVAPSYETPSIAVSSDGLINATANGKSATRQLSTQSAKTVTPTKSSQIAVRSGQYTTGIVTVGAIPDEYIVPSGSQTLSENKTYDVTSLASVTVDVPSNSSTVNIETITVRPSSASTTFKISGLKGQPKFFALAYSANLTSASTRYVVSANYNGTQSHVTYAYKSGSNGYIYQSTSYLSVSYSDGALTLKTSSTTNGGSFYNGNYRLVYAY